MKGIRQAIVLAGGRGARLGVLTAYTPKPMLPIQGRPFLEFVIWNLKRHGIRDIVLSVGYLSKTIENHFGDGSRFGVTIRYCREEPPAGTGGAVKLAREMLDDHFLVLNGDTLFDVNYLDLILTSPGGAAAMIALRHVPDTTRFGRVQLDGLRIDGYGEKTTPGAGDINGGVYYLSRDAIDLLPPGTSSLEADLFPLLCQRGLLHGKRFNGFFLDIGIPEAYERSQITIPMWQTRPTVFLDRDGVINVDHGYVHCPEQFEWIRGAKQAIRKLNDQRYLVVIVTNQAGIGRGYYTERVFFELMNWVQIELGKCGAHFDAVYHCPCHPEMGIGQYRRQSTFRKPGPGMILKAIQEWPIDRATSFMIGDSETDHLAAVRAGIDYYDFHEPNLETYLDRILSERLTPATNFSTDRVAG